MREECGCGWQGPLAWCSTPVTVARPQFLAGCLLRPPELLARGLSIRQPSEGGQRDRSHIFWLISGLHPHRRESQGLALPGGRSYICQGVGPPGACLPLSLFYGVGNRRRERMGRSGPQVCPSWYLSPGLWSGPPAAARSIHSITGRGYLLCSLPVPAMLSQAHVCLTCSAAHATSRRKGPALSAVCTRLSRPS